MGLTWKEKEKCQNIYSCSKRERSEHVDDSFEDEETNGLQKKYF